MSRRILILDDDNDFTSLLADVFSQAGHEIDAQGHPDKALKAVGTFKPDLIVTDHGLPGMTGREFLSKLREAAADLPVVVVSGNLDNHAIRDYINAGARGVFLKPLNIFSLLKRIEAVLDERDKAEGAVAVEVSGNSSAKSSRAFAGVDKKSRAFLQRLQTLRNFKSNLLLVGREGTDYVSICSDLCALSGDKEYFLPVSLQDLNETYLLEKMENSIQQGAERVTVLVTDTASLEAGHQKVLFALAKKNGSFANLPVQTRLVFCLNDDLELLYEAGNIDDSLYMFLGTSEVRVPSLADCPADLTILARRFLARLAKENGWPKAPTFDDSAEAFLRAQKWEREHQEFYETLQAAAGAGPSATITASLLRDSASAPTAVPDLNDLGLEGYLTAARDEIAHAAAILADGNLALAAEVLEVREQFFQS